MRTRLFLGSTPLPDHTTGVESGDPPNACFNRAAQMTSDNTNEDNDDQPEPSRLRLKTLLANAAREVTTVEDCDLVIQFFREYRVTIETGISLGSVVRYKRELLGKSKRFSDDVFIVDSLKHRTWAIGRRRKCDGEWSKRSQYIGWMTSLEVVG